MGTFLLSKMSLNVITNYCKAVFVLVKISCRKISAWDPPWGISILADFRPMGYKLSCCDSLWSR